MRSAKHSTGKNSPESELENGRVDGSADDGQVAADGELPFVLVQVREQHHLTRRNESLTYEHS